MRGQRGSSVDVAALPTTHGVAHKILSEHECGGDTRCLRIDVVRQAANRLGPAHQRALAEASRIAVGDACHPVCPGCPMRTTWQYAAETPKSLGFAEHLKAALGKIFLGKAGATL